MMKKHVGSMVGARRLTLVAALGLAASLGALSSASSALANGYSVFAQCPVKAVAICLYGVTEGGEFTIGSKTVPVKHPITLQGGLAINEETGATTFVGALNGETLLGQA